MAGKNKSNVISLTRVYDAPVKAVWDAWTDPKQAAKWWGPRGFTLTTHSKDLRPGGIWHYTMHGPDGTDYPNKALYHEVEKHSRLVYDHGGNDEQAPLFRVTVTFKENKGKTTMEMAMALKTPEAAEETKKFIKKANGNSTWDRLAEYLEKESSGKERFVINRAYDCPIDLLYKMWTDPEHFSRWLAPTGFTMKILKGEIKTGGTVFYVMSNGTDTTMHGSIDYRELHRPDRLVYTQQFRDEKGGISRHPHLPTWPETMLTVITLSEEGPDSTRVTVTWEPYGKVSAEELEAFVNMKPSMMMGWTGSLDKLESLLASG